MKKEAREKVGIFGTAVVVPVCFIGTIAACATAAAPEAWWGWLFLGGMGIWFLVVLPWLGRGR